MVSSSSYAPNESYSTIIREELWLQGSFFSNIIFGIQITLCVLAFVAVLKRSIKHSRMRIVLLVYIAVLFSVTAAAQGFILNWIQMGFITQRNYPGGPDAFLSDAWSTSVNLAPSILGVFANWMLESLLVWRCHVVCSNTGERLWWLGFAIPLLLLIVVFVMGSLLVYYTIHNTVSAYILPYGISSLALNLIATGAIAGRLLVHRHRIASQLGRAYGQHYVSITMVVVESAAVYTCILLVALVAYATNSSAIILFELVILQVQTTTSVFIIWRIACGQGWTRPMDTQVMSAVMSSLNTRVRPPSQANVIQLEVLSTRRDEVEDESIRPTENESKVSFHDVREV